MIRFFNRYAIFSFLLAIVLMVNTGGVLSAAMMSGDDGMMTNCPYMGMSTFCTMSPLEHLTAWQQMFSVTVQQFASISLLLLLITLAAFLYFTERTDTLLLIEVFLPRQRYKERGKNFDPLRSAFARGIIHSKAF